MYPVKYVAQLFSAVLVLSSALNLSAADETVSGKLTVDQNLATTALRVEGGKSGQPLAVFVRDDDTDSTPERAKITIDASSLNPEISFSTMNSAYDWTIGQKNSDKSFRIIQSNLLSSNINNYLVIKNGGNVGIGTASPAGPLQVVGRTGEPQQGQLHLVGNGEFGPGDAYVSFFEGQESNSKWSIGVKDNGNGFSISHGLTMDASPKLFIKDVTGNVGIGTITPTNKLEVNGTIRSKEIIVETTGWSDFVFDDDYELRSLSEVSSFIAEHGHLPDVPSANTIEVQGLSLGMSQAIMMQKIEELTLYTLQQNEQLAEQQKLIEKLLAAYETQEKTNSFLSNKVKRLEKQSSN